MALSLNDPYRTFDLVQAKEFTRALAICNVFIAENPDSFEGYARRAGVLEWKGEREKSLADRNIVVRLRPDLGYSYHARGKLFMDMGDFTTALADLTRASSLEDEEMKPDIDLLRAECHTRLGQYDRALALCAQIPDEHVLPAFRGLLDGSKHQIIAEIASAPGRSGRGK